MSSTNAPQPDTAASAPAEVFDSTVAPAQGQVSADQGPGPNNSEGPIHAGELNTIDRYFYLQFIALTSFIWDTSMSPGQLIWSIPIHPTFVHQFMAHLSKMYNAFVGGFEFSISVAGTGFHAGKLMVTRLPPNIRPETLRTVADITAFPYMVIDPKALETIVKGAMDQRNVMYHYLPYNANDPQTFGGFLAVYVLLPLATSSTGATQISVQVLSKPAMDFYFTQVRPINPEVENIYKPVDIERSLDFRTTKTHPIFATRLTGFTAFTAKDVKEVLAQTWNCVKLDKTPMNGELFERFDAQPRIRSHQFVQENMKSLKLDVVQDKDDKYRTWLAGKPNDTWYYFSFDGIKPDDRDTTKKTVMQFLCERASMEFVPSAKHSPQQVSFTFPGKLRLKHSDDDKALAKYVFAGQGTQGEPFQKKLDPADTFDTAGFDLLLQRAQIEYVNFNFFEQPTFDADGKPYAPPIAESLITFQSTSGDTVQPHELREVILASDLASMYKPHDSLIFELVDDLVDLPLIPLKLHFNGYFTTLAVKDDLVYKFDDPTRYYVRFVGALPETTPMVGGRLPISSPAVYWRNAAMSKLASSGP